MASGTRSSGALRWPGTIKSKTEGWKKRPDHAIRSSVAITKLLLGHDILKKKNNNNNYNKKNDKCDK